MAAGVLWPLRPIPALARGARRSPCLRGLVEDAGTEGETGATLFRTTSYFLERLGLAQLSDLPDLTQFLPDNLDEELDRAHDAAT